MGIGLCVPTSLPLVLLTYNMVGPFTPLPSPIGKSIGSPIGIPIDGPKGNPIGSTNPYNKSLR